MRRVLPRTANNSQLAELQFVKSFIMLGVVNDKDHSLVFALEMGIVLCYNNRYSL